jgi:hypothetical protein
MCPACMTSAAIMFAGATSAGGLTAFIVKRLWWRKGKGAR